MSSRAIKGTTNCIETSFTVFVLWLELPILDFVRVHALTDNCISDIIINCSDCEKAFENSNYGSSLIVLWLKNKCHCNISAIKLSEL